MGAGERTARAGSAGGQEPKGLDEVRLGWLALALAPGLGPKRILDAVREIGSASRIFELTLTELEGLKFPAEAAQFIFDGKARHAAEEEWSRVSGQNATVVTYSCAEYQSGCARSTILRRCNGFAEM